MLKISDKNLEKLREIIDSDNESKTYRTDGQLVRFFNNYGFKDTYSTDTFLSRAQFTEERLAMLNSQ